MDLLSQDAEKVRQRRSRIDQRLTETQRTEAYASSLRLLRPCWTVFFEHPEVILVLVLNGNFRTYFWPQLNSLAAS